MEPEKLAKLKAYAAKSKSKVFALRDWVTLNMKPFNLTAALECIYDYCGGKVTMMDDVIDHLTAKRKVYGRTQVYGGTNVSRMDIRVGEDGKLTLTGYERAEDLPLKGQRVPRNPNIFRKDNNQIKKTYQDTEKRLVDIGAAVRELWPTESKLFISLAIVAIRKFAKDKKLSTNKVIEGLKNGKLVYDDDTYSIVPKTNEGRVIIIDETTAALICEEYQMTEYRFYNSIKAFLHDLLVDPVNAQPNDALKLSGLTRYKLLRFLTYYGIVQKNEKLNDTDENGDPKDVTMSVSYRVPKKGFDYKLKRLFIKLFEKNLPPKGTDDNEIVNEDGELTGGATGSDASGQYVQPIFGVQRRDIYNVKEATTTSTVGDYTYDAPCFSDEETRKRKNGVGGSVSVNRM